MVGEVGYLTGPPLHVHRDQDDTFLILEGVVTLQVGEEFIELRSGDFASVPPGTPHTFDNIRKEQPPVKVVNVMTPGGLDALFNDPAAMSALRDPSKAEELWERYGLRIVGPPIKQKLGLA